MSTNENEARAASLRSGIPFANLEEHEISPELIEQVPSKVALHWRVIPVALKDDQLVLATDELENPRDRVVDASIDLRRRCQPALASRDALHHALEKYYSDEE